VAQALRLDPAMKRQQPASSALAEQGLVESFPLDPLIPNTFGNMSWVQRDQTSRLLWDTVS
jgi:hypothetical protein